MTDRERWILEMAKVFASGQLSGELVIRFRDGVPVEAVPSPKYRPPTAGRRESETGS